MLAEQKFRSMPQACVELKTNLENFAHHLNQVMEEFTGRSFVTNYYFKDSSMNDESSTYLKVNNVPDCSNFACIEMSTGFKQMYMHVESLLKTNTKINDQYCCHSTENVHAIFQAAVESYKILSLSSLSSTSPFGMGGGSGLGFQLYCDDQVLLTTGGGGGGGVSGSQSSDGGFVWQLAGGGGAGMQLNANFSHQHGKLQGNDSANFVGVGGGGGCSGGGSRLPLNVSCGCGRDVDSLAYDELRSLMRRQYTHDAFNSQCSNISVYGGGGGGGGSVGAGMGYGFSFSLTQSARQGEPSPALEYGDNSPDLTEQGDEKSVGVLFLEAAKQYCENNFSDWCCYCTAARLRVTECLASPDTASDQCKSVLRNRKQVAWLEHFTCCWPPHDSESGGSDPHHRSSSLQHIHQDVYSPAPADDSVYFRIMTNGSDLDSAQCAASWRYHEGAAGGSGEMCRGVAVVAMNATQNSSSNPLLTSLMGGSLASTQSASGLIGPVFVSLLLLSVAVYLGVQLLRACNKAHHLTAKSRRSTSSSTAEWTYSEL